MNKEMRGVRDGVVYVCVVITVIALGVRGCLALIEDAEGADGKTKIRAWSSAIAGDVEDALVRSGQSSDRKARSLERIASLEEAMAMRIAWARAQVERGNVGRGLAELESVEAWLRHWAKVDRDSAERWRGDSTKGSEQ